MGKSRLRRIRCFRANTFSPGPGFSESMRESTGNRAASVLPYVALHETVTRGRVRSRLPSKRPRVWRLLKNPMRVSGLRAYYLNSHVHSSSNPART
jgi:hypothetical protein